MDFYDSTHHGLQIYQPTMPYDFMKSDSLASNSNKSQYHNQYMKVWRAFKDRIKSRIDKYQSGKGDMAAVTEHNESKLPGKSEPLKVKIKSIYEDKKHRQNGSKIVEIQCSKHNFPGCKNCGLSHSCSNHVSHGNQTKLFNNKSREDIVRHCTRVAGNTTSNNNISCTPPLGQVNNNNNNCKSNKSNKSYNRQQLKFTADVDQFIDHDYNDARNDVNIMDELNVLRLRAFLFAPKDNRPKCQCRTSSGRYISKNPPPLLGPLLDLPIVPTARLDSQDIPCQTRSEYWKQFQETSTWSSTNKSANFDVLEVDVNDYSKNLAEVTKSSIPTKFKEFADTPGLDPTQPSAFVSLAKRKPIALTTDAILGSRGVERGIHVWRFHWKMNHRGTHSVIGVARDAGAGAEKAYTVNGYKPLVGNDKNSWGIELTTLQLLHPPDLLSSVREASVFEGNNTCSTAVTRLLPSPNQSHGSQSPNKQAQDAADNNSEYKPEPRYYNEVQSHKYWSLWNSPIDTIFPGSYSNDSSIFKLLPILNSSANNVRKPANNKHLSLAPPCNNGKDCLNTAKAKQPKIFTSITDALSCFSLKIMPEIFNLVLDMTRGTVGIMVDRNTYLGHAFQDIKGLGSSVDINSNLTDIGNKTAKSLIYPVCSAVWGHGEIQMKYIGGLTDQTFTLKYLCRYAIRTKTDFLDKCQDPSVSNVLPKIIPTNLFEYLCMPAISTIQN